MHYFTIKVDQEVFDFIKDHATSFDEGEPNRVLRQYLPLQNTRRVTSEAKNLAASNAILEDIPAGIPSALKHILEVVLLVRKYRRSRKDATREVARRHGVAVQTVNDKYGRQLTLSAEEFDEMLDSPTPDALADVLEKKFERHRDRVRTFLRSCWS